MARLARLPVRPGIGALVLTCAGGAWAFAALANRAATPNWEYAVAAAPVVALLAWGVQRLVAVRQLVAEPQSDSHAEEGARRGRLVGIWFGVIFTIEIVAIALAGILLSNAGRSLLVPVVVVAIVGIHFLPLAQLFRVPVYHMTGLLLMAAALLSLRIADERDRVFAVSIAAALVLWASAARVLAVHTSGPDAVSRPRGRS